MARRVIFIKNPSSGSNFRTINGGGGGAPRPKKPRKPKATPSTPAPSGPFEGTGGARYTPTPSDWFVGNTTNPLDFGSYDPNAAGTGPYLQEFTEFQDPLTLLGELYDIFTGVAQGGNIQFAYGTVGTMKFGAGTFWDDAQQERFGANRQLFRHAPSVFGATPSNPFPKLPNKGVPGLNPNRNKNRPWWAK